MIIAIEGNTGTGKTLVYDYINSKGYIGIKEYSSYIKENELIKFPPFPPKDMPSLINSHKTWEIIEKLRSNQIENTYKEYVLDRSFLSIFAFEYAKKTHKLIYDCEILSDIYLKLYDHNMLSIPDVVIHLKSSNSNILSNRENLVNPFLYDPITIADISDFITEYGKYLCDDNYYEIENSMADKNNLYKNVDKVLDYIAEKPHIKKKDPVSVFKKIGKI